MSILSGKSIVLGVSGGVAAYKAVELARLLIKAGATVDAVLTEAGARFVTPVTFQAVTGRKVWQTLWDERMDNNMAHIDLGRRADAILIAPATADLMARLAHGHADDLLTTLCLARDCPLALAPAMNRQMWSNPATQRNVRQLQEDGIVLFGPAEGEQACGETGPGRMLEPDALQAALRGLLTPKCLSGRKVVITAGPTFEAIDPVRGITNASSGKMGFALAEACADAGASVCLISGPVSLATPFGVTRHDVASAAQMHAKVIEQLAGTDVFISVAAVADYRVATPSEHKLKKQHSALSLELAPNIDILADVAARDDAPFCVGFAAESQNLTEYAEGKRRAKKLPMLIGNLVQDGLGGDDNEVIIFDDGGAHPLGRAPKRALADAIVRHLTQQLMTWRKQNASR